MTVHCIVVPAIHEENTLEFMRTVAADVMRDRVILVDNTDDGCIFDTWHTQVRFATARRRNGGVAAAWNIGVDEASRLGAEFVTLCSTSVRFDDGAQGLCRTADYAAENGQWVYGFESLVGWKCITFGMSTFDRVGGFDEEFWPAYFEDNDFIWRLRCDGILEPRGGDRALRKIPWVGALQPRVVEDAHAIKHAGVEVRFDQLQEYYEAKWGGPPGEETSCTPLT